MGHLLLEPLLSIGRESPGRHAVSDGRMVLTFRRMVTLASVFRAVVARSTPCERVGILLPASAIFPPVFFGVLWSGRTAVPLNFLLNPDELSKVVRNARLDVILTINHFRELAQSLPARPIYLDRLPLRRKMLWGLVRRLPPLPDVDPHDTAVILYTSGTTAEPKGVELTYRNLYSNAIDTFESLRIDPRQTFLNVLPPFHVFGLTGNVVIPSLLGAGVFAIPRFAPLAAVKAAKGKKISLFLAVPSMYAAILKLKSAPPDAFRHLYLAVSGGEPLSERVREGFQERFGVTLRQGYGLTETSPVVSLCSATQYREGTVGRPIRNVEIRMVDADRRDLPKGSEGEILVRGPGVMKGYFEKPEETRRVLDPDGWFATGDIGRLDDDGFLSITGRAKDMLIIAGENVFPQEIETVLENHESVLQAAVIGIADELRGECPVAFVVPKQGVEVTEEQLRQFAKQSLAGFKVPKRIVIRADLPAGPTGKLIKRKLRELL